ncbi:MAG: UDP-N-acetylglucosamine 2-epimerase [Epulopiscium sp. Nuni2H_MBin003]|nr:MAG: UDP-N-acetylglucosamine 2-epimerase [Epulopiscium sp. Nuni2H_MBin003]
MKILSIFGTRPEAVKMAPLIKELENDCELESFICITAQHREMLDQVMEIFNLTADYDLDIMTKSQTLVDITTKVLTGVSIILDDLHPDLVLVHGDTTTSFAASLAAFYKQIPVGDVEAGLRSFNKYEPFPEEINRRLTGVIADVHFSPTATSKQNLLAEGVSAESIFITGNTVIDVLKTTIIPNYRFKTSILNLLNNKDNKIITITAHRRENLGQPLRNICCAIKELISTHGDLEIVYAVHKNPAVMNIVDEVLSGVDRVHLVPPLDLKDMHNLLNLSYLILTDSGGLQEEVPALNKPVLVLRNVTERPEGIEAGTLKLVGTDTANIVYNVNTLLTNQVEYKKMSTAKNPFGDGFSSARIVSAIKYFLNLSDIRIKDYN